MNVLRSMSIKSGVRLGLGNTYISIIALFICFFLICTSFSQAKTGTVLGHQKISDLEGSFNGVLDDGDWFGTSVASPCDLNGDDITDIVVGAPGDCDGGSIRGAVWVLFLDADGKVASHQKISDLEGNFTGILDNYDGFGDSVAGLGDLNNDDITDIVVGATGDDDGGSNRGTVWVLFLDSNGTVKSYQKISDTQGSFTGILDNDDWFGNTVTRLGDLNGDGISELAVGAAGDDDGGPDSGAVWILFLDTNGTVKSHQKISRTQGNFTGIVEGGDLFGSSIASIGDLNGDGVTDLAVGAAWDDDGAVWAGAVWILFLDTNGMVNSHQKISNTEGNFSGTLEPYDLFGYSVASLDDLDGDGVTDIAVGSNMCYGEGCSGTGAVWVLFLNPDGTVKDHQKISDTEGNFNGDLDDIDQFGRSITCLGDLNSDGVGDIAVGANLDDDGGSSSYSDRGAVWVLFLYDCLYMLEGDINIDCKVDYLDIKEIADQWLSPYDFFDFALMAINWLVDCNLTPDNPACIPE